MKYGNKKVVIDGYTFDSRKEGNRYAELKLLHKAGKITKLILQPEFVLQPAFKINKKAIREIKYIADFQYVENGQTIVEDCKGFKTKDYLIKRKMFLFKYGLNYTFIET